jgi:DNA ligase-1
MFKVLLSPREDPMSYEKYWDELTYPMLASPKLDGIRCVIKEGRCKSRKYIDLPSMQAHEVFGGLEHFDGELIAGNPTEPDVYNRTQSMVMSRDKYFPDLRYYVFDWTEPGYLDRPFEERFQLAADRINTFLLGYPRLQLVPHTVVNSKEQLMIFEEDCLLLGYEGIMLRNPKGIYKNGRATWRQNIIKKLKRFQDDEAVIIGFIEAMDNYNEDIRDNLGNAKRSKRMEGMFAAGTLGKFICSFNGMEIEVPPGVLDHTEREVIWNNQELYEGKILKFRHFPFGVKDKPRFPRFVGWRTTEDM